MTFRVAFLLSLEIAISASLLHAADIAAYRDFRLGMTVADVSRRAKLPISDTQLISSRPQRIEELDWHVNWERHSAANSFGELLFRFYNGELFEMAVIYDREQTRGLTESDMIEAISEVYGPSAQAVNAEVLLGAAPVKSSLPVTARWEDATSQLSLVHVPYGPGYAIVISSRSIKALAEKAIIESERLDHVEAPQRELARREKQLAEAQAADEKARLSNKAGFRP